MIPHNRPTIGKEEKQAVERVLNSGWLAQGKEVEQFENEFCDYLGLPRGCAVAVSSGTAGLYLALWYLSAEDYHVNIPVYTCSAVRNAIRMENSEEYYSDCTKHSVNIDIKRTRSKITIIPYMYGIPFDITKIKKQEKDYIIEDCSQSLGAKVKNIFVGLNGFFGVYSFYATKLITTGGQGGMIVSKNKKAIDVLKDYRDFDMRCDKKSRFNFQMTDIQAAIGREQLKKLPQFLNRREEIFQTYKNAGLKLIDNNNKKFKPVRYRAIIRTEDIKQSNYIIDKLNKNNINTIIPIEEKELLDNPENYPNAYKLTQTTVSLPIYPTLKDEEVNKIIKVVKNCL
jgi:perosamine synthetase